MTNNPIIWSDFPDVDAIRVDDTYYMVSTTMHYMPGAVILRSYDLVQWEIITHVYDSLDDTPAQLLEGEKNIYGKGMWAPCFRYNNGIFYVLFAANDTRKTYLYQSSDIMGPWEKTHVEGFYHDASLLFDDDRIYMVYGNNEIYLTELKADLSGPKPDGLHRMIIKDEGNVRLGYEGAHVYKINDKYYVFLIHWLNTGSQRRVEACYVADSLEGDFTGGDILDDDMGYHNSGVAQGGVVDTPCGDWYAILFQDHGAIGRIPVLVPMDFQDDFPILGIDGHVPKYIEVKSSRPDHEYAPLYDNDDFDYVPDHNGQIKLKNVWEWNHTPNNELWSVTEKPSAYTIVTGKISPSIEHCVNTLTQRLTGPTSQCTVTIDGSELKDGDFAGLSVLQGAYSFIALTKDEGKFYLVMIGKDQEEKEYERIPIGTNNSKITLRLKANFSDNIDIVDFFYQEEDQWVKVGVTHKLYFRLDHFTGARVGLFLYSTRNSGGKANFHTFKYKVI